MGRKLSLGWGPSAFAIVALVAVLAAVVWVVVSDDGSSGEPVVTPDSATPAAGSDPAGSTVESGSTAYLWRPTAGYVRAVHHARGQLSDAEFSPEGDRLVYEGRDFGASPEQIYLLMVDGTTQRLTRKGAGAYDPTWSPDGAQIAFAARPRGSKDHQTDIFVMDADGSHIRLLAGTVGNDADPDWSPDGSRIAFHGRHDVNRGQIWVVTVRTGKLTRLTAGTTDSAMDPAWSPNGRWIAYSAYREGNTLNGRIHDSELWVMRSDGTDNRPIVRDQQRVNENPSWSPDGRLIVFERRDWAGGHNRILMVDPKTGRVHLALAGAEATNTAASSWGWDGILLSLPSRNPDPSPVPVPRWLRVESAGVDATVVLRSSGCELKGDTVGLEPGVLTMAFVNESYREGYFKVVKVPPGRRLADLRAGIGTTGGWGEQSAPSATDIWSSPRAVTSGRWAIVCSKDQILAPNGINIVRAGVVPIDIE